MVPANESVSNVIINKFSDNLIGYVNNIVAGCLSTSELALLENEFHKGADWNEELYKKALLNMYSSRINNNSFSVRIINTSLLEPIMIYINQQKTNKKHTVLDEEDSFNIDDIVHIVSMNYVKLLFNKQNKYIATTQEKNLVEFKLPQLFGVNDSNFMQPQNVISKELSYRLLVLYVIADHAAYHYFEFVKKQEIDYTHHNFQTWENNNKLIHGNFYVHDLITKHEDYKIDQFINAKVDDPENNASRLKKNMINLQNLFVLDK